MIEIVVIVILSALLGWKEYSSRKERARLINALIAKNARELQELNFVDKVKPESEVDLPPDLIPIDEMSADGDDFKRVIRQERGE